MLMKRIDILMRVPNNVPDRRVLLSPYWTRYQWAHEFGFSPKLALMSKLRLTDCIPF